MLKPVGHQNRFSSGGFDNVLQSVQLLVVYGKYLAGIVINGTVSHLAELIGEGRSIGGSNVTVRELQNKVALHFFVPFFLFIGKVDSVFAGNQLRHRQVVRRLHADSNVRDCLVYGGLGTGQRLIAENDLSVSLVRHEVVVTVSSDKPAKTLSYIQQPEFCPEVHQTVAAWRTGQSDYAGNCRPHLHQRTEALCLIILEAGQLVHHNGIEVERQPALVNEPLYIFTVNYIDICLLFHGRFPFSFCTDSHRNDKAGKMVPLFDFSGPSVAGHTKRRDDQHLMYLEAVKQHVVQRRQRDTRLTKPHVQQNGTCGMAFDIFGCEALVVMRIVLH